MKLPERLTTRQTALVTLLLVALLALAVVFAVPKLFPATVETTLVISTPIRQLKTKFDLSLLDDPRFTILGRVSSAIDPEALKEIGRPDPFAPVLPPLPDTFVQPVFPRFR